MTQIKRQSGLQKRKQRQFSRNIQKDGKNAKNAYLCICGVHHQTEGMHNCEWLHLEWGALLGICQDQMYLDWTSMLLIYNIMEVKQQTDQGL